MSDQFNFRVVIRGNLAGQKQRLRRVRTISETEAGAFERAGIIAEQVTTEEKFENVTFNVYPPSGLRCDGRVSKGHVVVDGFVVKAKAGDAATETEESVDKA